MSGYQYCSTMVVEKVSFLRDALVDANHALGFRFVLKADGLPDAVEKLIKVRVNPDKVGTGGLCLDLLVTLARIDGSTDGATLQVSAGERTWLRHEVPPARTRAWQSPAATIEPTAASATLTLELSADDPDARIDVRDIGLFSRRPPIAGTRAP